MFGTGRRLVPWLRDAWNDLNGVVTDTEAGRAAEDAGRCGCCSYWSTSNVNKISFPVESSNWMRMSAGRMAVLGNKSVCSPWEEEQGPWEDVSVSRGDEA